MLDALRKIFTDQFEQPASEGQAHDENALQIATCVLLLEVAHSDLNLDAAERAELLEILKAEFDLSEELAQDLVVMADEKRDDSVSYWEFTTIIREQCSPAEREKILELLWRVVYADNQLSGREDVFMRQCAGAMKMPHDALIRAKLRVIPD
jgi:uncharacterized tellurite resistance protein B-like protein